MRPFLLLIVTLLLGGAPALSQNVTPESPGRQKTAIVPLALSVPVPPAAFRSNELYHLCYEIHVTNLSPSEWTVQNIQVTSQAGSPMLTVEGKALDGVLFHPARARDTKPAPGANIAPGEAVIAYLWIDLPNGTALPTGLENHLNVKRNDTGQTVEADVPSLKVMTGVSAIQSPLRGKGWLAANGPSNTSQHRRALIVVDGTPHISQRYAIDWVQVGVDFKTYQGDPKDNRSYRCFGVEAHAIADATVVETKDGLPENVPNEKPAVPITLETVAGNHINLDLGDGVYAMYAHLQPGSLRVRVGDRVKAGQVLGLVGNTGNSSEPHLHFQLMNANSPLGSEGLPYTLSYEYEGQMSGEGAALTLDKAAAPQSRHDDIPMEDELVDFEP